MLFRTKPVALLWPLVLFLGERWLTHGFDLSLLEIALARVVPVHEGAFDRGFSAEVDSLLKALLAERVKAVSENHALVRLDLREAHRTLELFGVGDDVVIVELHQLEVVFHRTLG